MSEKCSAKVRSGSNGFRTFYRQCMKKAARDGFCNAHHPESIERRRLDGLKRFDEKMARARAEALRPNGAGERIRLQRDRYRRALEEIATASRWEPSYFRMEVDARGDAKWTRVDETVEVAREALKDDA